MKYIIGIFVFVCFGGLSYQLHNLAKDVESVLKLPNQPESNQKTIPRLSIMPLGSHPKMGDDSARVKMILFIDYECMYCAQFLKEVLPLIITEYINQGKVQLIFKDRPLKFHKSSYRLAITAHAAFKNNKFSEFLYDVWTFQKDTSAFYTQYDFSTSLDSLSLYKESIDESVRLAEIAGITGTPTFIINNRVLVGKRSFQDLKRLIDYSYDNEMKITPIAGTCTD
jgi:protein-disulfide isomerase